MQKQTAIYLSDNDRKRLDKIKEVFDNKNNSSIIQTLIKEEYERILKYRELV